MPAGGDGSGGGDGGGGGDSSGGGEGEGDGKAEFPSRPSATIPTTRAATATSPTSPIAPCLADTRDLGVVAVAGTVRGGGSAGTVSSTSPLIAQLNFCAWSLPNQERRRELSRSIGASVSDGRGAVWIRLSAQVCANCAGLALSGPSAGCRGCGPWLLCVSSELLFCQTRGKGLAEEQLAANSKQEADGWARGACRGGAWLGA
eukprot:scaffold61846_cov69-Phaeocystis_antarctica.AAC.1